MTLKTSLFSKGIYKSTVKRYMWGSVLYFIILFMITCLPIILGTDLDRTMDYMSNGNIALLYYSGYIIPSILLAMAVPTAVGLLVFRFVHSKKASVFTHSLPVKRSSMYISSLAGAFTLMFVPIILNGLILAVITAVAYYNFTTIASCFVWMGLNLLTVFLMFSCVCFVSMLTGNSFAMVGLNILIHAIVPLATLMINVVAGCFLYGMSTGIFGTTADIMESNYVVYMITLADGVRDLQEIILEIGIGKLFLYIVCAVLLYVASWVLYKKRNLENAEDVAGFKCLNPIFKYIVTTLGSLCVFAIFSSFIDENVVTFLIIMVVFSALLYFASEMILKKTLKVWNTYKGYIGFAAVFALAISVFAFTDFFGYENRIPDTNEVEEAAIYSYFYGNEEPYANDRQLMEFVAKCHEDLIAEDRISIVSKEGETSIRIKYKMADGSILQRLYPLARDEHNKLMEELYKFKSYKQALEKTLYTEDKFLYRINLSSYSNEYSAVITEKADMISLCDSLRKDIDTLTYSQMNLTGYNYRSINIHWNENPYGPGFNDYRGYELNANYKHTLNWLREHGYEKFADMESDAPIYISYSDEAINYTISEKFGGFEKFVEKSVLLTQPEVNKGMAYRIEGEALKGKIREYFNSNYINFYEGKNYLHILSPVEGSPFSLGIIEEEKIPEFLEYIFN